MPDNQSGERTSVIGRRAMLKFGAAAAAVAGAAKLPLIGSTPAVAQVGEAFTFTVEIEGAPEASKNIREIHIDDMVIEPAPTNRALRAASDLTSRAPNAAAALPDLDHRLYGPGAAHWGSARFTFRVDGALPNKEIEDWWQTCRGGKNIRKNITVTLYKSDRTPARSFNLLDCFPTAYSSGNFDTSSTVQTETMRVKLGRVEFKT